MTLYYSLVFALLVMEMSIFLLLVFPLPFTWRKKTFEFISNSPVIAKLQYGMKITFIFILILFVDSVNRVYRVQREISEASQTGPYGQAAMGADRSEVQARKFYSQRNMYLCGFTLFLSLILNRTHSFILDILRLEQTVKELRASTNEGAQNGAAAEVIEKKNREIEAIKAQAEGLTREYNDLSDRYNKLEQSTSGTVDVSKKDLKLSLDGTHAAERIPKLDLLRGHPSTSLLPTTIVYEAVSVALNSPSLLPSDSYAETRHPLHYGADNGNLNVREEIGRWCSERYGLKSPIAPDRLFLTNGASYGLNSALQLFTSPGTGYTKRAFLISPTYFLASRTFEDAGFADKMTAIKSDKTSIDFDALLAHLRRIEREVPDVLLEEGLKPILRSTVDLGAKRIYKYVLYCVPTYSNPTGETWDLETRKRLVQIAREWDILIISDDVYDFLGNDDQRGPIQPRLVTIDGETATGEGNTLSNCSFSKLIGPGLRAGWIESATPALASQLGVGGANHSGGCASQFSTAIIYTLLLPSSPHDSTRRVDSIIASLTGAYTKRCRYMLGAIREFLPEGTEIWGGRGGFFVWVGLPAGIDAKEVVKLAAEKEGLIVANGAMSECPGEGNQFGWGDKWVRVSISYLEENDLVEGIKRLGRAVTRWSAGERTETELPKGEIK